MKMCGSAMVAFLAAAVAHSASAATGSVTPVQQVIDMLKQMLGTSQADVQEELKIFQEYTAWKEQRAADLDFEIKTSKAAIEKLQAAIGMDDVTVQKKTDEIASLDGEIAALEKDKSESEALRAKQLAEYKVTQQDYSESVDALERAIQTLKAQAHDRPEAAAAFVQSLATRTTKLGAAFAGYLHLHAGEPGAPSVAAYEFQSASIVNVLEGLLKKFSDELQTTIGEESNTAHAHAMKMIDVKDSLDYAIRQKEDDTAHLAGAKAHKAEAVGTLGETQTQLAADEELLSETVTTYTSKKATFEQNQKVRTEEAAALAGAIEILSGADVSGSYAKHIRVAPASGDAPASAASFLQVSSSTSAVAQARQRRAVTFLAKRAEDLHSKVLSGLAKILSSGTQGVSDGPFAKIATMIKDLITKLQESAANEADHQAWCNDQLKANKIKRDKKTSRSEKLAADEGAHAVEIEEMGKNIAELTKEQAELAEAMQEATAHRQKEKAANEHAIVDAKAGVDGVKRAIVLLREFYDNAGAALIQQVPEMAEYHGQQDSNKGIIGMLEVIQSDFARLEADTTANEAKAASEYMTFMADSKADMDAKHKIEVDTALKKDQKEFDLSELKKDHAAVDEELAAANKYYEYLTPLCVQVQVTYNERVENRQQEIAALKEAYEILDGKTRSD